MKKSILITGSTGYLGTYLVKSLIDIRRYNLLLLFEDLTSDNFRVPPVDVIIHLAGKPNSYTGDPQDIWDLNFQGTVHLVKKCASKTHFIFLSSDYVFRSHPTKVYNEQAPQDPETLYGQAKAQAENYLKENHPHFTILRTSMFYGYNHPHRKNFFKFVEERLAQGLVLELFTDVYSQPTYIADLCDVIKKVIDYEIYGIYHACGVELISRYELGKLICKVKGYDQNLIVPMKKPDGVKIPSRIQLQPSRIFLRELKTNLEKGVRLWH